VSIYVNTGRIGKRAPKLGGVPEIQEALGQRIRELRTKQGYSQEAFADRCGVHRTFMGTVERGESNISFQNLVKVATALGLTLSQLVSSL
jgi:transcriptional regulator with XRE-family HTH domain